MAKNWPSVLLHLETTGIQEKPQEIAAGREKLCSAGKVGRVTTFSSDKANVSEPSQLMKDLQKFPAGAHTPQNASRMTAL